MDKQNIRDNILGDAPSNSRDIEQGKTIEQKNADWGYVLGHMVSCIMTDPITPFASSLFQKKMTGTANIAEHLEGEFLGDIVAVPATIALQRFAPELMAGIRTIAEPILRPIYQNGALREAEAWAHQNRIDENSNAFEDFRQQQYEYEMSKVPLQLTWTMLSLGANVAAQKAIFHNQQNVGDVLSSVALGTGLTLALQTAGRAFAPKQMHSFDDFIAQKIVAPTTNILGMNRQTSPEKLATSINYLSQ